MGIQYPYAETMEGDVVFIGDTDPTPPRPSYKCLSCRRELRARYCRDKQDHFFHKVAGECVPETYWHRLAKLTFAKTYRDCLRDDHPFELVRHLTATCNHYQERYEYTCTREVTDRVDLTEFFDRVEVEADCDGFRADVLLSSSTRPEVLLVEFFVTHACEEQKVEAGYRILEIKVESEEDALNSRSGRIDDHELTVFTHNFKEGSGERDVCGGACRREFDVFRVYESGKAVLIPRRTPQEIDDLHRNGLAVQNVITEERAVDRPDLFREGVRTAHAQGVPIKNCLVCRYHGTPTLEDPVFCKTLRRPVANTNDAASCDRYTPVDPDELAAIDKRNAEYSRKRFARRTGRRLTRGWALEDER